LDNTPVVGAKNSLRAIQISEAVESIYVCGSHGSKWAAYSFVDTGCDKDERTHEFNENPIASDSTGLEIEADPPTCDPREYFLRTIDTRMKERILKEWEHVVRAVENTVKEKVRL
jgi:hypothetical protein